DARNALAVPEEFMRATRLKFVKETIQSRTRGVGFAAGYCLSDDDERRRSAARRRSSTADTVVHTQGLIHVRIEGDAAVIARDQRSVVVAAKSVRQLRCRSSGVMRAVVPGEAGAAGGDGHEISVSAIRHELAGVVPAVPGVLIAARAADAVEECPHSLSGCFGADCENFGQRRGDI